MIVAERHQPGPIEPASTPIARGDGDARGSRTKLAILLGPGLFWLSLFFLAPLGIMFAYSFATRGTYGGVEWVFTLENYRLFVDPLYLGVFRDSLWLALITTVLCLLVGYPFAYAIARARPRWRSALLILVIVPFWTNFLVRTYAMMSLMRNDGLINRVLLDIGIIDSPLTMLFTKGAVVTGLVYGFLPLMVLPLYASIEKFDFTLVEAAEDLGANRLAVFLRIVLPLTVPGILAGSILVFIPSVGTFVTSDLLGGGKAFLIGNLIQHQFGVARNWPFGAALSFILSLVVLACTFAYLRVVREQPA